MIFPIPLQDLPFSSYREEDNLKADIERVTGIDDSSSSGVGGAEQTATGVQLVQAAANVRIVRTRPSCSRRRRPRTCCEQWVALNQQHIIEDVDVPGPAQARRGRPRVLVVPAGAGGARGHVRDRARGRVDVAAERGRQEAERADVHADVRADAGVTDPRKIAQHGLTEFGRAQPRVLPRAGGAEARSAVLDLIGQTLIQEGRVAPDEFQALVQEAEQDRRQRLPGVGQAGRVGRAQRGVGGLGHGRRGRVADVHDARAGQLHRLCQRLVGRPLHGVRGGPSASQTGDMVAQDEGWRAIFSRGKRFFEFIGMIEGTNQRMGVVTLAAGTATFTIAPTSDFGR
jgi:hypothetical protein